MRNQILGISQVVLGVNGIQKAFQFFEPFGFIDKVRINNVINPPEKKDFIQGEMATTHDLAIISPPAASPPIELVKPLFAENKKNMIKRTESLAFEVIIGIPGVTLMNQGVMDMLANSKRYDQKSLKGVRFLVDSAKPQGVVGFIIYCTLMKSSLSIWHYLGFKPTFISPNIARINVPGLFPKLALSFFLVEGGRGSYPIEPDMEGVICPTFLCKDVEKIASFLKIKGFHVGKQFEINPFGSSVKVFFLRTKSGELYEFLSIS